VPSQAQGIGQATACSTKHADRNESTEGRPHDSPASRGVQDSPLDCLRDVNHDEEGRWIEVILSALVDDPHITIASGVLVREHLIDFMPL
jgi:hypothetical protein